MHFVLGDSSIPHRLWVARFCLRCMPLTSVFISYPFSNGAMVGNPIEFCVSHVARAFPLLGGSHSPFGCGYSTYVVCAWCGGRQAFPAIPPLGLLAYLVWPLGKSLCPSGLLAFPTGWLHLLRGFPL